MMAADSAFGERRARDRDAERGTPSVESGSGIDVSASDFEAGQRFGDYILEREVAHGGMGVVYRARQVSLDRTVAVKLLLLGRYSSAESIERFRREAQSAAALRHPNIVAIHEIDECAGQHFIAMEFVEGRNLAELMRDGPLPPERAADCARAVAEAIHYAHGQGVLHRDLKPSNVLVDALGQIRITDFGLAKKLDGSSDLTMSGQMVGTPNYLSPEAVAGKNAQVGPASDVYAIGALLYELLTGRPPFLAQSLQETLLRIRDNEAPRPRLLNPAIARDLETICLKCLEKEPARRYASAQALADDLGRWMKHEPIHARSSTVLERAFKWSRRQPRLAVMLLATIFAVTALVATLAVAYFRVRSAQWATEAKAEQSRQRLVHLNVNAGNRLVEAGELHSALVWFVAALALEQGEPARERVHRQRIGAVLRHAPELEQLWFHDAFIYTAAFSPDGSLVASGGLDRTARIWDAKTGQAITPPLLHAHAVLEVRFTPDGRRLLTVAEDRRLRIWDAANGQALVELPTYTKAGCYDVSRDGRRIVAPSPGGAQIFNLDTGEPMGALLAHEPRLNAACFSGDGTRVFVASIDGGLFEWTLGRSNIRNPWMAQTNPYPLLVMSPDNRLLATVTQPEVRLWNTGTLEMLAELPPQKGNLYKPSFSPDGRWLATVGFQAPTRVWNATNGQPVSPPLPHEGGVQRARFSPDSRWLVTASWDRTARVWDAQTGEPAAPIIRHAGFVLVAEFSPDGHQLLTAGQDETARLWRLQTNSGARLSFVHSGDVWLVAYDREGKRVLTGGPDGVAHVWDGQTGTLITSLAHQESIFDGAFCGDGNRVVVSCRNTAHVWDLGTAREIGPPAVHSKPINCIDVSSDGRQFLTASRDGTARVWSTDDVSPVTPPLENGPVVHDARFSPDGQRVVTAGSSGQARLWDSRTGRRLGPDLPHIGRVQRARFSPNGRRVITACTDETMLPRYAQVWNVETGQPDGAKLEHGDGVRDAAFSPDGRFIASGGEDFAAIVWDAATGKRITPALRHRGVVVYTIFSPDSRLLLTVSSDGTARVWDVVTGDPVTPPLKHGGPVRTGRWSPDGREVLTGSADGTVRVWDVSPEQGTVAEMQRRAEVLSAHRFEPGLGPVPLTAKEMRVRWPATREKASRQ
jgi:WD40 repeat protein/predicted Ser/Thr protein kinase